PDDGTGGPRRPQAVTHSCRRFGGWHGQWVIHVCSAVPVRDDIVRHPVARPGRESPVQGNKKRHPTVPHGIDRYWHFPALNPLVRDSDPCMASAIWIKALTS